MNVEAVATKLFHLVKKIKSGKGPLELLGLFLREDSPDLWDLVVAAPWLKADERASFEYIAGQLRTVLGDEDLAGLSRIVILDHGGAVLQAFHEQFDNRTGLSDVHFVAEGGALIKRVYIIVARPVVAKGRRQKTTRPRRRARPAEAGPPHNEVGGGVG